MLAGLLYQHTCVQLWPAFLNGDLYGAGKWTYFPLAMLYKTPVAELAAFFLAGLVLLVWVPRSFRSNHLWTIICLLVPFSIFAAAALATHLNIGLRNVLPLYPFLQIACGCAAAILWDHRPKLTRVFLVALGVLLAYETLSAWPDYIAFFNFPTGGEVGGLAHLSDSNLDWGQDLKSLAHWQQQHAELPMYADLFESVDPEYYGLKYHPIIIPRDGPLAGKPTSDVPMQRGWIAVSATHLQGLYVLPWEKGFYEPLRNTRPVAIIGGTIYIYLFEPSS
jgi:hypothetical protein